MSRMLPSLAALAFAMMAGLGAPAAVGAEPTQAPPVHVYKSESCGCCGLWIDHLKKSGFKVTAENLALGALARLKQQAGLKNPELQSCHTAKIGGYVVEGHVPAEDIRRLIAAKPDAVGLTVPGMPLGSPGMEAGDSKEPYEVLLVKRDGTTSVFAQH